MKRRLTRMRSYSTQNATKSLRISVAASVLTLVWPKLVVLVGSNPCSISYKLHTLSLRLGKGLSPLGRMGGWTNMNIGYRKPLYERIGTITQLRNSCEILSSPTHLRAAYMLQLIRCEVRTAARER